MTAPDERMRILHMIENRQISAEEGNQLLSALDEMRQQEALRERNRMRTLRIRITDLGKQRSKVEVRIPMSLIDVGLRLGAKLVPRMTIQQVRDMMRAIDQGAKGQVFEMQDLDEDERIEIFVEQ